jgi:hypothetical protein
VKNSLLEYLSFFDNFILILDFYFGRNIPVTNGKKICLIINKTCYSFLNGLSEKVKTKGTEKMQYFLTLQCTYTV